MFCINLNICVLHIFASVLGNEGLTRGKVITEECIEDKQVAFAPMPLRPATELYTLSLNLPPV